MPPRRRRDPFRHAQLAPRKRVLSVPELEAPPAIPGELCRCGCEQHDGLCPNRTCGCRYNRPKEVGGV